MGVTVKDIERPWWDIFGLTVWRRLEDQKYIGQVYDEIKRDRVAPEDAFAFVQEKDFRRQLREDYSHFVDSDNTNIGGENMRDPFEFLGGIGGFFSTWAPWLMVILLFYAAGTIFNVSLGAKVGK